MCRIGAILLFSVAAGYGQGLTFESPYLEGFHPLDQEQFAASPLNAQKPAIMKLETKMFRDTSQIDFEKRQITFRRTDPLGYTMWEFHYGELSDYLSSRRNFAVDRSWKKNMAMMQASAASAGRKSLKLEWEIPVQYPSWAQRVLGKEPPKLTIDGFLEITVGYENIQYETYSTEQNRPVNDFNFEINYEFGITGSVGRLINVNIRASKEQNFDISDNLKNFKIEYKESTPGELEDEIIQEVVVGYTGFSMPGTNLSGYSESHEGLMGIKIRSKLGPLELTTIASMEQGQSNKKTYSSSGTSSEVTFEEDDFRQDRYFFLDNAYRKNYIRKYNLKDPVSSPRAPPRIKTLSVWRSYDRSITDNKSNIREVKVDSIDQKYYYERLERDRHYYFDDVEGYIRFADSIVLQTNQQIAIFMRTEDSAKAEYALLQKGSMDTVMRLDSVTNTVMPDTVWTLWTLRPMNPILSADQDTSRFYLMWRNVYGPANFSDHESFKMSVKKRDPGNNEYLENGPNNAYYADIMGLSTNNNPDINNAQIYNHIFNDLILPPFDTSEIGFEPFNNPDLCDGSDPGGCRDSLIYRYGGNHNKINKSLDYKPSYQIVMSGSSKKTSFDDLGWGIMEGTELVKADGVTLKRDQDYTISYDMGVVDLISSRAKSAEKIEIEYQSEALFVPDRKMFLGTHGKVQLPFISDKSYAGASFLFQSTESNDDVPRLDQEPYNKMLLDINTHLEFEPEWMTKLVNALPLVESQSPSSVIMELELAHSRVNPNKSGSAYIDDFEDSKQSDLLSNDYRSWYIASPPVSADSLWSYPPAWDFYWFSPRDADKKHRIRRDEILVLSEAEKKATMTGSSYEWVLRLHATPAPPQAPDSVKERFGKAWAGVMTPISQSFADKQQMQYFEFFVKPEGDIGSLGKLRIQMGEMREDISLDGGPPNGRADREDTASIIQSQTLNPALDIGWDRLRDTSEIYLVPGSSPGIWDTLRYRHPWLGIDSLDPSKDNFREYYDNGDEANYRYACRREGDDHIEYSEDINFDGAVQTAIAERYFEFTIDLNDPQSPFIDTTINYSNPGTWRKYRIPLRERIPGYENAVDSINDPSWSNITMVRMVWDDFDSRQLTREKQLVFWNMEFVGNQWIEMEDSTRIKIRSSVINTKEDATYEKVWERYKHLINREKDEYGYEVEQSLRLNFVKLASGDTALVRKSFLYQTLNLSAYRKLSLQVYGAGLEKGEVLDDGNTRFVFRFGSDDSTYYEYSRPIYGEWNNSVDIDLRQLSALKDAYMMGHRDSAIDTSDGTLRIRASKGRQPNFSLIQWMALGVVRGPQSNGVDSLSGEIWVNEMKLDDIKNITGTASRLDLSTRWSDLLTFQARMEYENGNFRRMTETENTPDNTQLTSSIGASINLDEFLPDEWGLSLQTGLNYNSTIKRPQLKNETDVYLVDNNGNPDGFMDIVKDAVSSMFGIGRSHNEFTPSEFYQTSNVGRTFFTGYKKNNHAENPVVNLLADRWSADARYSTTISEVRYGKDVAKDTIFAKCDTSDIYSGQLDYDLTPYDPPEWLMWSPFKSIEQEWFPGRLKNYEITLLPRSFTVDVADISLNKQRQTDTWRRTRSAQNTFTVQHGASLNHTPISPLCDLDYTIKINRDMIDAVSYDNVEKGRKIFKRDSEWKDYMGTWGEKDRSQHAGIKLTPQFFDWLTTSADYSGDYNSSVVSWMKEPESYLNTGVKSGLSLNGTLKFDDLLEGWKKKSGKTAFAGMFDMMDKGFEQIGLRQISLTYSATSTLKNNYVGVEQLNDQGILGIKDFMLYQFGVKGRSLLDVLTGEMDDDKFMGMNSRSDRQEFYKNDSRTVDRSVRLSSGISIKPLDLSFNQISFNYGYNKNIYPDSSRNDTTITFPDIAVSLSSPILNRLSFVKANVQDLSLSSSFTWRRSERMTAQTGGSSRSNKFDMTPLLSLSGQLKRWPIRIEYRHNRSRELTTALSEEGEVVDTNRNATMSSHEITINYEIPSSSKLNEIRLLNWTIPIKGKTTVGLKFNHSDEKETETKSTDKTTSLIPNLSYIFTENVTGRAEYRFEIKNEDGEKKTINEFALTVQIRF